MDFAAPFCARGHILPDQALFLTRCGVDEIVVENEARLPAFERAFSEFSVVLQPRARASLCFPTCASDHPPTPTRRRPSSCFQVTRGVLTHS